MRINNVLVRVKHELGSKFPRNSEDKTRDPGGRMLISVYILLESKIKKKQYLAYVNVPSKLPINQIREYQEYCLRKLRKSSLEHYLNAKIYPEVLVRRAFTKNFGLVPKNELSDERHFIL